MKREKQNGCVFFQSGAASTLLKRTLTFNGRRSSRCGFGLQPDVSLSAAPRGNRVCSASQSITEHSIKQVLHFVSPGSTSHTHTHTHLWPSAGLAPCVTARVLARLSFPYRRVVISIVLLPSVLRCCECNLKRRVTVRVKRYSGKREAEG